MAIAAASRSLRTGLHAARAALRAPADVSRLTGDLTNLVSYGSDFAARRRAAAGSRGYAAYAKSRLPVSPFRGLGAKSCYRPDEERLSFHAAEYRDGLLDHASYLFQGDAYQGDRPWHGPIGEDGLPTWVDWRLRGAVTPVQHQISNGPCWAFASIAAMEVENFLETGQLVKLSEQHLIDGNNVNNDGFDGGCVPEAYKYIYRDQCGISFAKDYPYVARQLSIKEDEEAELVPLTGYGFICEEHELKKAVSKRAVTAAIEIDPLWLQYSGGIISGPSTEVRITNHAVTVVAYGSSRRERDFFIIKDSFGKYGPYGGYAYIERGVYPEGGTLGLARFCWFPSKSAKVPATWVKPICSEKDLGIKRKPFQEIHRYLGQEVKDGQEVQD